MTGPSASEGRAAVRWTVALAALAAALYAANLRDYFIGDDFDLIHSFYGKPASYFPALLWSNESGDVWRSWGIDPALGRGYLRPLKIWMLALDSAVWGTNPLGFHLVSSACFVALIAIVFAILRRALPERPVLAAAGAASIALHPVFAEVVPFITAREEVAAAAFGLASFLCFLRFREDRRSPLPFHLCYAAALLTKESAIVYVALPLGWELVQGRVLPPTRDRVRDLARAFAPTAALLAIYFALRRFAFGNFVGGDGAPVHYLDPAAFAAFHARFWQSLGDPTLLSVGAVRGGAAAAGAALALLAAAVAWRFPRLPLRTRRALLFFGPVWYLAATAILHGTYFAVRHNVLPVIGIGLFATVAVDALSAPHGPRAVAGCAAGLLAVSAVLFLPPSLATSAEWRTVAASVSGMRAEIDARTAGLAPGCAVSLSGVPQWVLPPFYFGWGLRSALAQPFTRSDLADVCTVVDARNRELTRIDTPVPSHFDAVVALDPARWVSPTSKQRHLMRAWREGIVPRGDRRIP